MLCFRCKNRFDATAEQSWDNACPKCGCLAWLHRGLIVEARVTRIQPYEGSVWSYSARVAFGDNIQGIAGLKTAASVGDTIRCKVTQVDHQLKLVMLDQADAR